MTKAGYIFAAFFALLCAWYLSVSHARNPAPRSTAAVADCTQGGDSVDIRPRERDNVPATWTPHQLDSMFKSLNIYTKFIGPYDTTNKYVQREVVSRVLNARDEYRGRDTSFLFLGEDCIQIELRLGSAADEKDTILWRNICEEACFDSVTIPLGCYADSTKQQVDTVTTVICDTVCTATQDVEERLYYYLWGAAGAFNLQLFAGCSDTLPATGIYFKMVRYNGQWYQPLDTAAAGNPFYPADDSCYVDAWQWQYFIQQARTSYSYWSGQGPWLVDSTKTVSRTFEVDCDLYGTKGITRTITNCRDTLITDTVQVTVEYWIDAGRDTTIWDNLCDCLVPKFICEDKADSTRHVKYIYDYEYTRDSVQCEEDYQIPIYDFYTIYPRPGWEICGNTELDTLYRLLDSLRNLAGTDTRTHPNQRHIRQQPYGDSCWAWSCMTLEDNPPTPPATEEWWIDADTLDQFFPCPDDSCVADSIGYYIETNWCCGKDTTVTYICDADDGENQQDTVNVTFYIPDKTQPCDEWTYTDWELTDSTLIDSTEWYTYEYTVEYILSYEDTCCYTPSLNGVPFCDLWIVDDCCGTLYQDERGVWHIPCCDEVDKDGDGLYDGTDYNYIENNDKYLQKEIDTLKTSTDAHEIAIDGIRDTLNTLQVWQVWDGEDSVIVEPGGADTYAAVTGWYGLDGVRPADSDSSTGEIALPAAGWWMVQYHIGAQVSQTGLLYSVMVSGGGTQLMHLRDAEDVNTANSDQSASAVGLVYSDGTETITLQIAHGGASPTITIHTLQIVGTLVRPD